MAGSDNALQKAAQEADARADLAAMIAASRELGPEMDAALVESYINRHKEAIKQAQAQPQPPAPTPAPGAIGHHTVVAGIVIASTLAAYCVALVVTHGWLFWLIFPLMGWLCGWGFWGSEGKSQRRAARHEYHHARRELRQEYRARRRVPGVRPWEWDENQRDDEPQSPTPRNDSGYPPIVHV